MHTEKREDPLVELGYEVRDLNTKAIRNGAIGFFGFAFLSAVLGFVIFRLMNPAGFVAEKAQHRLLPLEPNPILQTNLTSKTDIMDLRQHEEAVLTAPPGWTDATKTKLHIPIDMAMRIIADRGLPATQSNMPANSPGHTDEMGIGLKPQPGAPGFKKQPPPFKPSANHFG